MAGRSEQLRLVEYCELTRGRKQVLAAGGTLIKAGVCSVIV
jgi:hypothetical protein